MSCCIVYFIMILLPPSWTRTDTLFPYTTLCRSRRADRERRLHPDWHRTAVDGAPAGTALTAAAHRARRVSALHSAELFRQAAVRDSRPADAASAAGRQLDHRPRSRLSILRADSPRRLGRVPRLHAMGVVAGTGVLPTGAVQEG